MLNKGQVIVAFAVGAINKQVVIETKTRQRGEGVQTCLQGRGEKRAPTGPETRRAGEGYTLTPATPKVDAGFNVSHTQHNSRTAPVF